MPDDLIYENFSFPAIGVLTAVGKVFPALRNGVLDLEPGTPDFWRRGVLCYRVVEEPATNRLEFDDDDVPLSMFSEAPSVWPDGVWP